MNILIGLPKKLLSLNMTECGLIKRLIQKSILITFDFEI